MRVALIAVPYDSGRRGERMGEGPEYLIRAGLNTRLVQAGHDVEVRILEASPDSWRAEIGTAFDLARTVARTVAALIADGVFPLVLSGNCGPAALGSVGGLSGTPVVFWFDAHGDFNTPETTVGGFLDGMALATLTGRCWTRLAPSIPGFRPVPESAVTLVGARDFDPLEAEALNGSAIRRVRPEELRMQLPAMLGGLSGETSAYLHLDLDVLDPSEGPVNCYAASGGLSRVDVAWAIAAIAEAAPLRAASLTALDPDFDTSGAGCEAALELGVVIANAASRRRGGDRVPAGE
jgi:arginase